MKVIPMEQLFSRKSRAVKKLGLDVDALSDAEKLDLMTQEPALLKRPIVVGGSDASVGLRCGGARKRGRRELNRQVALDRTHHD